MIEKLKLQFVKRVVNFEEKKASFGNDAKKTK